MCTNRYNNINTITTNSFNNNGFDDDFANSNYAMPNMRYGRSYVLPQTLRSVYSPAEGLNNGTMFPELVSMYYPNQSLAEMNYLRNYNERRCQG